MGTSDVGKDREEKEEKKTIPAATLPEELTISIMDFLPIRDVQRVARTSKDFYRSSKVSLENIQRLKKFLGIEFEVKEGEDIQDIVRKKIVDNAFQKIFLTSSGIPLERIKEAAAFFIASKDTPYILHWLHVCGSSNTDESIPLMLVNGLPRTAIAALNTIPPDDFDPNEFYETILTGAIKRHWDKVVELLLKREDIDPNIPNKKRQTPLSLAVQFDCCPSRENFRYSEVELVKPLIQKKINIITALLNNSKIKINLNAESILNFIRNYINIYNVKPGEYGQHYAEDRLLFHCGCFIMELLLNKDANCLDVLCPQDLESRIKTAKITFDLWKENKAHLDEIVKTTTELKENDRIFVQLRKLFEYYIRSKPDSSSSLVPKFFNSSHEKMISKIEEWLAQLRDNKFVTPRTAMDELGTSVRIIYFKAPTPPKLFNYMEYAHFFILKPLQIRATADEKRIFKP